MRKTTTRTERLVAVSMGGHLRDQRHRLAMTQHELGNLACLAGHPGFDQPQVCKYETGRLVLTVPEMFGLCELLRLDPVALVARTHDYVSGRTVLDYLPDD